MTVALAMVVAPLTAAAVGLLLGSLSRPLTAVIAISGPLVALILGLVLAGREPWRVPIVDAGFGIGSPLQPLPLATSLDGLAIVVAVMVGFVALLVQIYSIAYLRRTSRGTPLTPRLSTSSLPRCWRSLLPAISSSWSLAGRSWASVRTC